MNRPPGLRFGPAGITTVKLPPKLKKRISPLAKAAGKSDHAWMVDALASQVEREELRQSFVAEAIESRSGG